MWGKQTTNLNSHRPRSSDPRTVLLQAKMQCENPQLQRSPYLLPFIRFVNSSMLLKLTATGITAQEFSKHEIKAAARGSIHKSDSMSSIWSWHGSCHRALSCTACLHWVFIVCSLPVVHPGCIVCKPDRSWLNLPAKSHVAMNVPG
jgi:hypothetical protein